MAFINEVHILDASGTLIATLPASLIKLDKDEIYQGVTCALRQLDLAYRSVIWLEIQ